MKYFLLFFSATFYGQVLHHQMLSSQGQSSKTSSGMIIQQTIGQQSMTNTFVSNNYIVIQGFQQSFWYKYINSDSDSIENIKVVTYPNPFTETINFQFSKPITDVISISIFDLLGRLIYEQNKNADSTILSINLSTLSSSQYLIRLNATNLNYYTKIIKQ